MFKIARIKLTCWYLLIIMLISIVFSFIIYEGLMSEINRFDKNQRVRIERRLQDSGFTTPNNPPNKPRMPIPVNPELIEETKRRIILMLLILNSGILSFASVLGYFLAGRTLRPIKEMVENQQRFIGDASHELKTPLTSLKSAFEVYLRNKNNTKKEADRIITESIREVNKLHVLSESLLRLTKGQNNRELQFAEQASIAEVVNKAVLRVSPIAKKKEIILKVKGEDVQIKGVRENLVDLLVIFIDNAVKYSPKKSTVEINYKLQRTKSPLFSFSKHLSALSFIKIRSLEPYFAFIPRPKRVGFRQSGYKTDDSFTDITIKDHGIGIAHKDLPKIFDRFFRADTTRSKDQYEGFGLGLSIAKQIVDSYNGKITVDSQEGKGTTFTIQLPNCTKKCKNIFSVIFQQS